MGVAVRTIIIEDEKPAARMLQRKLDKLGISAETMLHSVEESIEWFRNNPHPDLIFLDIQLSDGLSFEIFENVDVKSAVIFTTAYDEYALKAFKFNSIDYLLKPIDEDDLMQAVSKFKSRISDVSRIDFDAIRKMLTGEQKTYKERFAVKFGHQLRIIEASQIECFYSENKGTYLHTLDNRDYLIEMTLDSLEQELDPKIFYRISRKFIIPIKSVKELVVYSNSRLKIILPTYSAEEVIVSREKVSEFRKWLE